MITYLKQKYLKYISNPVLPLWFIIFGAVIFTFAIYTRVEGIGYSNFQGDEINTVDFMYQETDGFVNYLLSQKRGPTQYIINKINISLFGYINEFYIRLPYLIFALAAFGSFYLLARKIFNRPSALFTMLLLGLNGLFIAFARISQYQSVMYFLVPLGVYLFVTAFDSKKISKLLVAAVVLCISLFTHYDTLSVMPFFVIFFIAKFIRSREHNKATIIWYLKRAGIFFTVFLLPTLIFYIPLSQAGEFNRTSGYLTDRLLGGGLMPRTGHILSLISMYVPSFILSLTYLLAIMAPIFWWKYIDAIKFFKITFNKKIATTIYLMLIGLNIFGSTFSLYPIKPRFSTVIVIVSALAIITLLTFFAKKIRQERVSLLSWFLGAYSFYFFIMKDARTHVYVVFIPALILAGYSLYKIYTLSVNKIYRVCILLIIAMLMLYQTGFNYLVFIEKGPEYPWTNKQYFGESIYKISKLRGKKIDGVFGFNNYRAWEKVAGYYKNGCLYGSFNSNEKNSITYFYIREDQLRLNIPEFESNADNLIIVEGPHSWEYHNGMTYPGYRLIKTIYSYGFPVTEIYTRNININESCFE